MIAAELIDWAQREGFPTFYDVRSRLSIADLVKKADRCGVYCLAFANGETYLGLSVDVVKRFGQHRHNHEDIVACAVKALARQDLYEEETRLIESAESRRLLLRNFSKASFIRGDTDFDLLVSPEKQAAWLIGSGHEFDRSFRMNDEGLRRKKQKKAAAVLGGPLGQIAADLLREFLSHCIPEPLRTECTYWSVSLMPSTNAGSVWRVNVNWQEVAILRLCDEGFAAEFQVRRSLFEAMALEKSGPKVKIVEFAYKPGGADQIRLCLDDDFTALKIMQLLRSRMFQSAMKPLVLDLMRKGPNNFASSHCFQLVDAALGTLAKSNHI